MQKYKIKRAGREFVVYVGDDQVLRCATRREAKSVIASATGKSPHWFQKRRTDLTWLVAAIVLTTLVVVYTLLGDRLFAAPTETHFGALTQQSPKLT
jgi:hypothetical protein